MREVLQDDEMILYLWNQNNDKLCNDVMLLWYQTPKDHHSGSDAKLISYFEVLTTGTTHAPTASTVQRFN